MAFFAWDVEFGDLLPEGVNGVVVVVENTCNEVYTYVINGPEAEFVGEGDRHELGYEHLAHTVPLEVIQEGQVRGEFYDDSCHYSLASVSKVSIHPGNSLRRPAARVSKPNVPCVLR